MTCGLFVPKSADWFSRDDRRLTAAYVEVLGQNVADLCELRDSVARFAFMLGETKTVSDCSEITPR